MSGIESLLSQLIFARPTVERYYQHLSQFTEHYTAKFTHGLSGFLYDLLIGTLRLVEKQQDATELSVETYLDAVEAYGCDLDRKLVGQDRLLNVIENKPFVFLLIIVTL